MKLEVKEILKKGAIRKVQLSQAEFVSKQLISCQKEEWGPKTSYKFEANECIYPILPLQNGRFEKSEIHVAKRRVHVQTRLKRCIFFSSLGKKFKAICSLLLVRKLVQVPLSLLWFGTSTSNIHKTVKSTSNNLMQDKHQNNNLLRRHAIDWSLLRRGTHEPRYSNPLFATSRICHKLEKVCVDTSTGKDSLGQTINSVILELSLNKIKIQKVVSECQKLLNNPQTLILELTGLIGLSASVQEVLPARLNCRFPPNKINMIFIGKRFLIYTRQRAMKSQQVGWEDVVFSGN